jgi:hypothetical protein
MKSLIDVLERFWCKSFHPAPMWPIHGHYRCPRCLRLYPVAWEVQDDYCEVIPSPCRRQPSISLLDVQLGLRRLIRRPVP